MENKTLRTRTVYSVDLRALEGGYSLTKITLIPPSHC